MSKIIDIFAGAGGLSLGGARAGFDLAAAVEIDSRAIETHSKNFPASKHLVLDVASLSGKELLNAADVRQYELAGLVGGPPCQGFSCIGKRDVMDTRNTLFSHFFRIVSETKPQFFLAENVTGILRPEYEQIRSAALAQVEKEYDIHPPFTVCATDCGAPTTRTRVFFVGIRKDSVKTLSENFGSMSEQGIKVSDALSGLPIEIDPLWQSEESGWRPVEDWETDIAMNFQERVIGVIPDGVGHLPSLERYFEREEISGCMGTRHNSDVAARYGALGAGKRDPISKSVRLNPDGYCPTLRAGTDKTKGSYQAVRPIHPSQARVITPREAARLQGFPDWFVFHSTKWHSFRQIGNSVSPIVAEALLSKIYNSLC